MTFSTVLLTSGSGTGIVSSVLVRLGTFEGPQPTRYHHCEPVAIREACSERPRSWGLVD